MNCTNKLPCPLASGWVPTVGNPGRRLEIEVWLLIPLTSALRNCFKVFCVPQPKVSGSLCGLLITTFFFQVSVTIPSSHSTGSRGNSGSAVILTNDCAIPYSIATSCPHLCK